IRRDQVMRLLGEREVRRFARALAMLPEFTERGVLDRQCRRIERERRAWRDADRRSLMQREFADEIAGKFHGIQAHIERVGGACLVGELRATASPITRDAARAWHKDAPMGLASALSLDPPEGKPDRYELGALAARAGRLRDEHDRYPSLPT